MLCCVFGFGPAPARATRWQELRRIDQSDGGCVPGAWLAFCWWFHFLTRFGVARCVLLCASMPAPSFLSASTGPFQSENVSSRWSPSWVPRAWSLPGGQDVFASALAMVNRARVHPRSVCSATARRRHVCPFTVVARVAARACTCPLAAAFRLYVHARPCLVPRISAPRNWQRRLSQPRQRVRRRRYF